MWIHVTFGTIGIYFTKINANSESGCLTLTSEKQTTPIQGKGEVTLTFPYEISQ